MNIVTQTCFVFLQRLTEAEQLDGDVFNIASLHPIGCHCLHYDVSSRNYCY